MYLRNVPTPPPEKILPEELPSLIQNYIISNRIDGSKNIEENLHLLGDKISSCIASLQDSQILKLLEKDSELAQILINSRTLRGLDLVLCIVRSYAVVRKLNNQSKPKLHFRNLIIAFLFKIYEAYLTRSQKKGHGPWYILVLLILDFGQIIRYWLAKLLGFQWGVDLAKIDQNSPLVSLIIPVYNVENYVEQCLESALTQTYKNLEIILVDDCSTDGSKAVIAKVIAKYPQCNLYLITHKENKGLGAARNTAIARAKGEYIMFLDSDDYISTDYIQSLMRFALANKLELVCGAVLSLDANNKTYRESYFTPEFLRLSKKQYYCYYRNSDSDEPSDLFHNILFKFPDVAWAKLYHRRIFTQMLFPEGLIHEDFGFFIPTLSIIQNIGYYTDYKNYYFYRRQREGSIMMDKVKKGKRILDIIKISNFIVENILRIAPKHLREAIEIQLDILHSNIVNWLEFPTVSESFCQEFHAITNKISAKEKPYSPTLQKKLSLYHSQNLSWKGIFFLRIQESLRYLPELSLSQIKYQLGIWVKHKMHYFHLDKLPTFLHKPCRLSILILGITYNSIYILIKIIRKIFISK